MTTVRHFFDPWATGQSPYPVGGICENCHQAVTYLGFMEGNKPQEHTHFFGLLEDGVIRYPNRRVFVKVLFWVPATIYV